MSSTSSFRRDHEWPVVVYRKLSVGWEKLIRKKAQHSTSPSRAHSAVVKLSPRTGCLVVRQLRLRINLAPSQEDKQNKNRGLIVRRRNTLLVRPNRRTTTVVFRFESDTECLAFSDMFVELNPQVKVHSSKSQHHGTTGDDSTTCQAQDALSFLARLLYDDDFLEYVDHLESCMKSSEDGAKILESLCRRDG
uniref:Uncharacterized protein n=1 Tax=Phaeodactylum tricornutum TaxID=2850 RepID=A0A8J9WZ67_PHATR